MPIVSVATVLIAQDVPLITRQFIPESMTTVKARWSTACPELSYSFYTVFKKSNGGGKTFHSVNPLFALAQDSKKFHLGTEEEPYITCWQLTMLGVLY